jgi:hypothetical protein
MQQLYIYPENNSIYLFTGYVYFWELQIIQIICTIKAYSKVANISHDGDNVFPAEPNLSGAALYLVQ